MLRVVLIGLAVLALAVVAGTAYTVFWREETITIRVRGVDETVPRGTTVAEAAEQFAIEPLAGDLVDVQGGVLRLQANPGQVLLNGHRAPSTTELAEADSLRAVDGHDSTEPSTTLFVTVPAGMPSNPQFTLARTPGEQELARGRLSGKIAPRGFHASGPASTPKAVALTFDDGPSRYTPRILRVLERMHARATFFVVGRLAEEYPGLVRRQFASGMEVGSHTYSHPYRPPFDRQPHRVILEEIEHCSSVIAALGQAPTLFRPPGGSFSSYVVEATGAYGQRIVLWSVDPTDWQAGTTARQIVRRVLKDVRPGSIVVLHDGGGDRSPTAKALPQIVRGIRRKGLALALIDPQR